MGRHGQRMGSARSVSFFVWCSVFHAVLNSKWIERKQMTQVVKKKIFLFQKQLGSLVLLVTQGAKIFCTTDVLAANTLILVIGKVILGH